MGDRSKVWEDHAGFIAWPTVVLAIGVFGLWVFNILFHAAGLVPWWITLPVGVVLVYVSFTPLHEATHGNVGGSMDQEHWDTWVGTLAGIPLLAPFRAVQEIHLRHHGRTNDPVADPDAFIHGQGWSVVRGALGMWGHYIHRYFTDLVRTSEGARKALPSVVGTLAALFLGLWIGLVAGYGWTMLVAVILPAWWGVAVLAVVFDWLPHWPHQERRRFLDTRAIPDRWLDLPLLGQNLHLVHHLWPRVPFFRYRAVFDATEPYLRDHHSPIEPWERVMERLREAR